MVSRMMVAVMLLALGQAALAGEVLRLQAGEVKPNDVSSLSRFMATADRAQLASTRLYVVQFKDAIKNQDRELLNSKGLRLHQYLPDDAFLVEGEPSAIRAATELSQVQAVIPFLPQWKKSQDLPKASVFNQE